MATQKLTNEIITAAIQGFEGQKRQIDDQIAELRAMLSGVVPAETAAMPEEGAPRKRKKFSAATRRRMAEGQRLRYLKLKGETESPEPATPKPAKAKRKMSAAARKAIGAATRKRWALQKAAEAAKSVTAKKAIKKAAVKKAPPKAAKKAVKKAVKKVTAKKTAPAAAPAVAAAAV